MEKRLILAIVFSTVIIISFQFLSPKQALPPPGPAPAKKMIPEPAKETAIIQAKTAEPSIEEKEFEFETPKYVLTFSNIGGAIKDIRLKDYKDSSGGSLELVRVSDPTEYLFNVNGIGAANNLGLAECSVERSGDVVTCSSRTKDLAMIKKYILSNSKYGIELQLYIKNISDSAKELSYRVIGGAGVNEANAQDARFIEISSKINGKTQAFKRPKDGRIINPGIVSWTALKSKYFSLILKPITTTKNQFYSANKNKQFVAGVETDNVTIQPGSFIENKFLLYVGPSHIPALRAFGYELEETVNYGFFGGISKVMIVVMGVFYNITHSWGVSIILLSVFLNIILFPLTMKSFKSMQKMQELHPEMEKLKKQYKDNPQKLNKEMMELYKTYKINPFSGCLPMLLQMPVFIALYQALMRSIELRNTSFLWIKDLSSPDAVPLPFSLPLVGNSINILPLTMVVAMIFQQKMSTKSMGGAVTEEQKQQQKMMLILMPVMFGFIFYNMPSGLVMYWLVNTALTVVEQGVILKK